jgi:hypothetical protein
MSSYPLDTVKLMVHDQLADIPRSIQELKGLAWQIDILLA